MPNQILLAYENPAIHTGDMAPGTLAIQESGRPASLIPTTPGVEINVLRSAVDGPV